MGRRIRHHVIVSQGGRHGSAHGTYLRGQSAPAAVPTELVEVTREPGRPAVAKPKEEPKPVSLPPAAPPAAIKMAAPTSMTTLRRWSTSKLTRFAKQEGIEADGLNKDSLRSLLAAHLGLK